MLKGYKLNKWGKSARVSIPLHVWEALGWKQEDKVTYEVKEGKLIVSKEGE